MTIKEIEYIPLKVPRDYGKKWRTALGAHSYGDAALVIVHEEGGAFGVGEVSSIWDAGGSGLVRYAGQKLSNSVAGLDVFDISALHKTMDAAVGWSREAYCLKAGIEMAVYDMIGKLKDMPVYQLLGGKNREKVPISRSVGMGTVEERLEQISNFYGKGYRAFKLKIGTDYNEDLKAVAEVRKAYGDTILIRVDANMAFSEPKFVLNLSEKLYDLGVISLEQPLGPRNFEGLKFLREHSRVPIMIDESVWDPADALEAIRGGFADIMNVYVSESGGLRKARLIADLCDIAGIGFCIGSMPELGVGTAAVRHLGMAAPVISQPCDLIGNTYFADDIINEKLPVKDGFAYSLDGPGLGVTINWDKVDKYRTDR
ncbi:N-succinyl-L-Arg/Lys racemase [bioreactor metagenome]|uniref:N-succinyl-L-Arg/Lys racemase n=1 Tax=bioreactor metagenome TaxID=1076179 RepID=A0A644X221_9ZZZZ